MSESKVEAKRGRAYSCPECEWTGEKSQSVTHYVKKHCELSKAPFACTLCKFKGGTEDQLRVHAKSRWHKKRIADVEIQDDDVLKRRKNGAMILEKFDVLSVAESQKIWNERTEKSEKTITKGSTDDKRSRQEEPTVQNKSKTSPRKRSHSLSISSSSSSSSRSGSSSQSTSDTIRSKKQNQKSSETNPEPPAKKVRQASPPPADSGTESRFVPDFNESLQAEKENRPSIQNRQDTSSKIQKTDDTSTKLPCNPTLEKVLNELSVQLTAKENDNQLIATAAHGMTRQMTHTNDSIDQLNSRITHLVDTLAKKHSTVMTSDTHTNNTGLKHLMGDVRAELRVLNQTLNRQTSHLADLNTIMREHTTSIKQQTARLEASATSTSTSLDTFSKCFTSHLALLERIIRNRPDTNDTPARTERISASPRRRPNTFRGFHPRRPYYRPSQYHHTKPH